MKKLIVILMILIVGILACGCTSQPTAPTTTVATTVEATPVPTEVPTAVPTTEVTTEIPTEVVTTVVTTATPTPTPLPDVKVTITGSHSISPSTITIPAGTKVIFSTNSIGSTFRVAITKSTGGNNIAESGLITTKNSWSYTFNTAGKYYAADVLAPNNAGIIIVN